MLSPKIDFRTGQEFLHKMQQHFYVLAGLPFGLFCGFWVYYEKRGGLAPMPELSISLLIGPTLVVGIGLIGYAYWQYFRALPLARQQQTLRVKLATLYGIHWRKWWLLLIPVVILLGGYILSGNVLFWAVYLLFFVAFTMSNPTIYTLRRELRLSQEQFDELRQSRELP